MVNQMWLQVGTHLMLFAAILFEIKPIAWTLISNMDIAVKSDFEHTAFEFYCNDVIMHLLLVEAVASRELTYSLQSSALVIFSLFINN